MKRREFFRATGLASAASVLRPELVLTDILQDAALYFGLHPFVAAHPEAVFIKRTQVVEKTDAPAWSGVRGCWPPCGERPWTGHGIQHDNKEVS